MDDLWATKSEDVGLIVRAISFQDFQPMWSWSTNVTDRHTDRRTDRQTTCDRTVVHRAVKTWLYFTHLPRSLSVGGFASNLVSG